MPFNVEYNVFTFRVTGLDERNEKYTTLVNAYYELATMFYEWGWGQSFHFAYQLKHETFQTAIARHEYYLAGRLGVKAGDKILDVGCGIGGPMRNIARFTRASVTGVTLNEVHDRDMVLMHDMAVIINVTSSRVVVSGPARERVKPPAGVTAT